MLSQYLLPEMWRMISLLLGWRSIFLTRLLTPVEDARASIKAFRSSMPGRLSTGMYEDEEDEDEDDEDDEDHDDDNVFVVASNGRSCTPAMWTKYNLDNLVKVLLAVAPPEVNEWQKNSNSPSSSIKLQGWKGCCVSAGMRAIPLLTLLDKYKRKARFFVYTAKSARNKSGLWPPPVPLVSLWSHNHSIGLSRRHRCANLRTKCPTWMLFRHNWSFGKTTVTCRLNLVSVDESMSWNWWRCIEIPQTVCNS